MAFHAFSHAAAKALLLLGENTKPAARKAYQLMAEALDKPEGHKTARNWSVYSRVMSELWRNGWVAAGARAPNRAVHAATTAVSLDDSDYYTHWLLAYAYKIRSRSAGQFKSSWKQDMESALRHYEKALALLNKERPQNAVVAGERNAVSIERAETFVYLSEPDRALREMERIIRDPNRAKPDAWQDWAYAFALHQAGRSYEAAEICERLLVEKDANNDIRLLLAACQARCHMAMDGRQTIREFHKRRNAKSGLSAEDAEPTWTVALEIERGAFPPDMPGGGEKYWTESLVRAQLDESADTKVSIPTTSFLPSDDVILGAPRGDGATAAPGAAMQAPKPAGRKPAGPKPGGKKAPKRKAAAKKKVAKKKAAKKAAKRKVAKKTAKKRPTRSKAPARKAARRKAGRKAAAKRRGPKRKATPRGRR